jgi:hypothetical protein
MLGKIHSSQRTAQAAPLGVTISKDLFMTLRLVCCFLLAIFPIVAVPNRTLAQTQQQRSSSSCGILLGYSIGRVLMGTEVPGGSCALEHSRQDAPPKRSSAPPGIAIRSRQCGMDSGEAQGMGIRGTLALKRLHRKGSFACVRGAPLSGNTRVRSATADHETGREAP